MVSTTLTRQPVFSRRDWLTGPLAILVFLAALAGFASYQSRLHYQRQAETTADNLAQLLGKQISGVVEKTDLVLRSVGMEAESHLGRGRVDAKAVNSLLARQKALLADVQALHITDAEGVVRRSSGLLPDGPISLVGQDYFIRLRDDPGAGLAVGGPRLSTISGEWVTIFARRLNRPDGSFAGTVQAVVTTRHLGEMLSALNLGPKGMASLRAADLAMIERFPHMDVGRDPGHGNLSVEFRESVKKHPGQGVYTAINPLDGTERTVAYRHIPGLPWYIAVGLATEDYLAAWWQEFMQLAGIVTVVGLLILLLSRDVQEAAGKQLAASRLLQEAVDSIDIGFSIFDSRERLVVCNAAARDFFPEIGDLLLPGAAFEDIVRTAVGRGMYPEAMDNPERWLGDRIGRFRAADGRPFEYRVKGGRHLLITEHRTPCGHVVSNRIDVTELSRYRNQLECLVDERTAEITALAAQFRIFVEQAPIAIAMFDRDMIHMAASRRWASDAPEGNASLVGRSLYEVYPDMPERWKEVHRTALAGIPQENAEELWVRGDGSLRWSHWAVYPWRDQHGTVGGVIICVEDITDRKVTEKALAEERDSRHAILARQVAERTAELEAANKQLEGFIYASSHDLKGPLGRINSFSRLLEKNCRDRLDGEGLLFLNFIRENAIRLNKLIDDLLNHARIDQQALSLQAEDPAASIRGILRDMAEEIEAAGAVVRLGLPTVRVWADPHGLVQVLRNLLGNAVKYSSLAPQPTIEIGGQMQDGMFRLWVRDNGIGFSMEYHDKIFEIFRRLHTYAEYPGTGVGLALVKRAMERMGGRVWAESSPGQGATFYVEFEAAEADLGGETGAAVLSG